MKTPVQVPIERLRARLNYCPETGLLTWKARAYDPGQPTRAISTWNARYAGRPALHATDNVGYRRGSFEGQMLLAHRVSWALHHGRWPVDLLDHIDGNPSNNRMANLREVDATGNQQNMRRRQSSRTGVTGVNHHAASGQFIAQINVRGQYFYLGLHPTIEAAAAARKAAEREHGFHPNHGRAA